MPEPRPPKDTDGTTLTIALAGQPNVGKSTVFNLLTGLSQRVGNWTGKTVERKEGLLTRGGEHIRVVDLPGTYSLTAGSEEERITRDFILGERPDAVIMLANAAALERSLYLLAELLVLPAPVVVGLNMVDVAEDEGMEVQPQVLEAALGLPVQTLVASRNQGVAELVDHAVTVARNPNAYAPTRPDIAPGHARVLARVTERLGESVPEPYPVHWVALKLLEGDAEITAKARTWLPEEAWRDVEAILAEHEDAVLDVAGGRYAWIGRMMRAAVSRPRPGEVSITDRLDRVATHPLWGMLLLLAIFGAVFWVTFNLAAPLQALLDETVIGTAQTWVGSALAGAPQWVVGLLRDGVLAGAGVVLTFLPILVVFFAVLALLEDTGYLARTAYVMDRFMHAMGLHGKSFLPLFLGFGCNVPAVMGARVIESRSGRLLTILLAPLVPCSARLLVVAFLAPLLFGAWATLVAWGLVAVNLLVLAIVGVVLSRTVFRGQHTPFIMELPLYHTPNARTIGTFVWNGIAAFLRQAGSLILLMSVVVWALSNYPGPDVEASFLARFGETLSPLGALMGMDWRLLVALLASFVAKENAIATLGVLYAGGPEAAGLAQTLAASLSPATGLAFLVVVMLFIPCVATVAVMRKETGSWAWTGFGVGLLLVIALAAGIAVYQVAQGVLGA
jgi:ferrous iron transport protein B